MGMDVYGKHPTSATGAYFRRSVWKWRPLAAYICAMHPQIASRCAYWQSNDGDGLDSPGATALAAALEGDLADGTAQAAIAARDAYVAALPPVTCRRCQGGGACHVCAGTGAVDDFERNYTLEPADLREFAAFCAASGGFEIS